MPVRPDNFVKSKSIVFNIGVVKRVHLNDTDDFKQSVETNSSQMIDLYSLGDDSTSSGILRNETARPMFRGISDSITAKDMVIYTKINETVYYIGPLNNYNNPNQCTANFNVDELIGRGGGDKSLFNSDGSGVDFPKLNNTKLQKPKNKKMDLVSDKTYETSKLSDLTFEGRHGNSIRLGSRDIFPSITIDNKSVGKQENIGVGSTISMLSNGSIYENFGIEQDKYFLSVDVPKENPSNYTLNKGDGVLDRFDYEYGKVDDLINFDQIIILSDRITIDARKSDFTVSSNNNINFGATNNFTLNNSGYSIINSNNIYLGEKARVKAEPMVLGNELRNILVRLLEILNSARANVQGVPLPLVDGNLEPLNLLPNNDIGALLQELKDLNPQNGSGFFSKHHYIEQNDRSQNNEG